MTYTARRSMAASASTPRRKLSTIEPYRGQGHCPRGRPVHGRESFATRMCQPGTVSLRSSLCESTNYPPPSSTTYARPVVQTRSRTSRLMFRHARRLSRRIHPWRGDLQETGKRRRARERRPGVWHGGGRSGSSKPLGGDQGKPLRACCSSALGVRPARQRADSVNSRRRCALASCGFSLFA